MPNSRTIKLIASDRTWFFWAIALVLLKLWLIAHLPIRASNAGYDNLRYVILAQNFLQPPHTYDSFVLVRQPGYPLFIVLSYYLGIPLRFTQEILYLASGWFLADALDRQHSAKLASRLLFVLYTFAPFSFHWNRQTLQEVLYLPLTAIIFGCIIHLLSAKTDRSLWGWSLFLGVILAWFWNTRLEGIWILPAIGFAYLLLLSGKIDWTRYLLKDDWLSFRWCDGFSKNNKISPQPFYFKSIGLSIACVVLPVMFVTSSISLANFLQYGLFDTNDLKSAGFQAAYTSLTRVSPQRWQPMVAVPQATREEIYAVSPSFRKLKPMLETANSWKAESCRSGVCQDYAAGLFFWAFREAVVQAGYYKSVPQTEAFYFEIAREVQEACNLHQLMCRETQRLGFLPQLHAEYVLPFFHSIGKLGDRLLDSSLILKLDSGVEDEQLRQQYYSKITREKATFFKDRTLAMNQFKDQAIALISQLYRGIFPILLGWAAIGIGMAVVTPSFRQSLPFYLLILALCCIGTRVLLVAYIDVTSWSVGEGDRYLRPVLPMLWLAIGVGSQYGLHGFDRWHTQR
jgi:hypothetical protein